jgi:3-methyladenine DNA glycosylase AlkD
VTPADPRLATEIAGRNEALASRDTASQRALRREYLKALRGCEPSLLLELAAELRRVGVHRFFGDELISTRPDAMALIDAAALEALGEGMDSWDQVDCFSLYLSGPCRREGRVDDALIISWAASTDRWWRRAALVSTVALNLKTRGGRGDTARTLAMCERLVGDRDDMVVKAMSWALRELAKRDAAAVRAFVETHRGELASRVLREVGSKLETGLKTKRR